MCDSHCSDRSVLSRVAGSITILAGINRSASPEQLGSVEPFQTVWRTVCVGSCGWHGHTRAQISLYQCFASAYMVKPSCICLAIMVLVDTVGSGAGLEP